MNKLDYYLFNKVFKPTDFKLGLILRNLFKCEKS
jgi:hypothetical protein